MSTRLIAAALVGGAGGLLAAFVMLYFRAAAVRRRAESLEAVKRVTGAATLSRREEEKGKLIRPSWEREQL